jgi:hypothetical protein
MIKYRVIKKEPVFQHMDQEEALSCISQLRENDPHSEYDIEDYDWIPPEKRRLGRDPDLH